MNAWTKEPALTVALLAALIALAVGFGAPVTAEQVSLILAAEVAAIKTV